jgi:hypothetical protein
MELQAEKDIRQLLDTAGMRMCIRLSWRLEAPPLQWEEGGPGRQLEGQRYDNKG